MDKITAQNFTSQLAEIQWQAGFLSLRKTFARMLLRHWTLTIFLVLAPFVIIPWLWLGSNVAKTLNTPTEVAKSHEVVPTPSLVVYANANAIPIAPVVEKVASVLVEVPKLKLAQDLKFSEGVLFYTGKASLGPQGRARAKRIALGLPIKSEVELRGFAGQQEKGSEFAREFMALGRAVAVRDVVRGEGFKGKMTIIDPKYYLDKRKAPADPRQVEVTVILSRAQP